MIAIAGCGSPHGEFANDPTIQKTARDACESAEGMPNLGVNFNWKHSLSGEFDPTFRDEGTFDWGIYRNQIQKKYKFTCSGRFDDDHMYANAVLEDLIEVSVDSRQSPDLTPSPTTSRIAESSMRSVPPPEPSIPPSFGYPAFYAADVGDCVYYDEAQQIDGMILAKCGDVRLNARVTKRTVEPIECGNYWVGSYEPQDDYSKPIPYELVLCLEPL